MNLILSKNLTRARTDFSNISSLSKINLPSSSSFSEASFHPPVAAHFQKEQKFNFKFKSTIQKDQINFNSSIMSVCCAVCCEQFDEANKPCVLAKCRHVFHKKVCNNFSFYLKEIRENSYLFPVHRAVLPDSKEVPIVSRRLQFGIKEIRDSSSLLSPIG